MGGQRAFAAWYLDFADLTRVWRVLDAGCGTGRAAAELGGRLQNGATVVALDLDRAAVRATAEASSVFPVQSDVGALPIGDGTFDLVIAGHVLAYGDPLESWILEIRRVLRNGGTMIATANSRDSARVLLEIHVETCRRAGLFAMAERALLPSPRDRFSLENGTELLRCAFSRVDRHVRDGSFVIPNVDEAVALYLDGLHTRGAEGLRSMAQVQVLARRLEPFAREVIEATCDADGRIRVSRRNGCLVAHG